MRAPKPSLEESFHTFDKANPVVYDWIKKFTFEAINAGCTNLGISMVIERIRWGVIVKTIGDTFKINNNHRAYYARKFMAEFPQHEGFFETRSVKSDFQPKFKPVTPPPVVHQTERNGQQLLM